MAVETCISGFFAGPCALRFLRQLRLRADTVALWLFDEQVGVYPSSVLNDAGPGSHFLILGRGGGDRAGKIWQCAAARSRRSRSRSRHAAAGADADSSGSSVTFGLRPPPAKAGRTQPPLTWENAHFAAHVHQRRCAPASRVRFRTRPTAG